MQKAEGDERLRGGLFRDLDYITQEAESEKNEEEDLREYEEAGKTQFKINIIKGKEEELKAETKNFKVVLLKENKEEAKNKKLKVRNNKETDMGEPKQIRKQEVMRKCYESRPVGKSKKTPLKNRREK